MALGDFNGDGIPDLAVINHRDETVSILLGNGDGTFRAAPSVPAGRSPTAMALGDFNGDGIQDLVIADLTFGTLRVLLGNGDGTFQDARDFGTGILSFSMAVGDFNGDGILDLAVGTAYGGMKVLSGNGDGTFQIPPFGYTIGNGASSEAVADLNGDGYADLVVTNHQNVAVLLNDGLWPPHRGSKPHRVSRKITRESPSRHAAPILPAIFQATFAPVKNPPVERASQEQEDGARPELQPIPVDQLLQPGAIPNPQPIPTARHTLNILSKRRIDPGADVPEWHLLG